MVDLHVFKNHVIDWVVAASEADAAEAYAEYMTSIGCGPDEWEAHEWKQLSADDVLAVNDDDGHREEKTCAEWVRGHGRGFLCSTEF